MAASPTPHHNVALHNKMGPLHRNNAALSAALTGILRVTTRLSTTENTMSVDTQKMRPTCNRMRSTGWPVKQPMVVTRDPTTHFDKDSRDKPMCTRCLH